MAANRIKIAKDKAELMKSLVASNEQTAPFQTYVEVLVFAAALGAKHNKRVILEEISKRDPDPIPQEHFISKGYDTLIKLLAIAESKDINIIDSNNESYDAQRIHIFEEYVNGGLEILQNELRGAVDYSERILLFLDYEKNNKEQLEEEFDLSKFFK